MNELLAGWAFALRRLRAHWQLMAVAAIGVIVAATLLAVAPIYAQSMSELGLRFRLDRGLEDPADRVAWITIGRLQLGNPVDRQRREAMDVITDARVGWLGEATLTEERSERLDLSFPEFEAPAEPVTVAEGAGEPLRQSWGAFLFWFDEIDSLTRVVDGRLPAADAPGAEVVLPAGFRRHAAIGDRISLGGPSYDDCVRVPPSEDPAEAADEVRCRPSTFVSTSAMATIVGFVEPRDPDALHWQMFQANWEAPDEPFLPRLPPGADPESVQIGMALQGHGSMPLITTREQYFGHFAARLPELQTRHRSGVLVDIDALALRDVPRAIDDLAAWRSDINDGLGIPAPSRIRVLRELERFRTVQTFSQIPLLIILLQVVGIVVYYVVVVMTMLLDRQAEEVAVYRSRGASTGQLVGLTLVESLILAVPAALAGPWLAAALVRALGFTPTFEPITGGSALPTTIPPIAYVLAAGGAALALIAMLLPAIAAARRGIVDVKREQSRPGGRSIIQRYYLDLAMIGLAGLLLWQLDRRGSVFDPDAVGGWSADPLLLLSPLVFTLAVAALVLRLYPPLIRLGVRVLLVFRGTAVAIGLRRAGRSPAAYARMLLLLVMAIAVGTFAASYGPTVDRSLTERIHYAAGSDLRAPLSEPEDRRLAARIEEVRAIEGVRDAVTAHRGELQTRAQRSLPILAVDPERAAEMLWFREDFSRDSLGALMRRISSAVPAGGGMVLPEGAREIELSIFTEGPPAREYISARLRDRDGRYRSVPIGAVEQEGWVALRGEILSTYPEPLTFIGLTVSDRLGQNLRSEGALFIDDVAAITADGTREVVEDFEEGFRWTIYHERDADEVFEISSDRAVSGTHSARWQWEPTISPRQRVLAPADPAVPLSVIANDRALGALGAAPGGTTLAMLGDLLVPIHIRAVAEFFPTLDPQAGFLVANVEHLRSLAGTIGSEDEQFPTELWIDFAASSTLAEQEQIVALLTDRTQSPLPLEGSYFHRQAQVEEVTSDPTLRASGSGILVLAFVSVLGLSTLGFVVTLALGARHRTVEFAVLRAVGSSGRQILRAMILEWGIVLAIGLTIGLVLGRRVAVVMLSFLEVTEQGARVLPPFTLETDWFTLGAGIAILVLLVLVALTGTWVLAMRRANAAALRITQ